MILPIVSHHLLFLAACVWNPPFTREHLEPRLTVDPGTHINMVLSVVVDPQNKFVVSTSEDGTARVWDANSKLILKKIRFPESLNHYKQRWVLPAAISCDGERMAFVDDGQLFR